MKPLAHYRCLRCGREWMENLIVKVRAMQAGAYPCPACGGVYCKWLNYGEFQL